MSSIRRRLSATLVAGVLLLWCLAGVLVYLGVRELLYRHFDESLAAKARTLGTLVQDWGGGKLELEFADEIMPEFSRGNALEYFEIRGPDGALIERSRSLGEADLHCPFNPEEDYYRDLALPDGRPGRLVAMRLLAHVPEGSTAKRLQALTPDAPAVTLAYARDRIELNETLRVLALALAASAVPLALGTAWVVTALVRRGLRPLDHLANQAAVIDATNHGARFANGELHEELRPIYSRLNDLLTRIEATFENERRFTADVAHELRTPIAEVQALAEVALKWERDRAGTDAALRDVHGVAKRMEATVSTLLALVRCRWGRQGLFVESFDLAQTIRDVVRTSERTAAKKGLRVRVDLPDAATLVNDHTVVSAIVSNIWSNAVGHCPDGGEVRGTLEARAEGGWIIRVANTDNSLNHADLAHLFEPFWRKEAARSDSQHGGLGLALVREYARLVRAEPKPSLEEGAFRMQVIFRDADDNAGPAPHDAAR